MWTSWNWDPNSKIDEKNTMVKTPLFSLTIEILN